MPRKRVQIDPDEQFANIENIMKAIHQSEAEEASRRKRAASETAKKGAAGAAEVPTLDSMCSQWQLSM
jgi:hypothetical protein